MEIETVMISVGCNFRCRKHEKPESTEIIPVANPSEINVYTRKIMAIAIKKDAKTENGSHSNIRSTPAFDSAEQYKKKIRCRKEKNDSQ